MTNNNEILTYITQSFDLKRQGYYKQAIEMLYKALAIEGNNVEILSQLADLYFLLGNDERVRQYSEKTLDINPQHLECLKLLAKLEIKNNNLEKAKEIAGKILEISSSSEYVAEYISILRRLGDFNAIKEYKDSHEITDKKVIYEIASAYADKSKYQDAISMIEPLVAGGCEDSEILTLLGILYYNVFDLYRSKAVFQMLENKEDNYVCMHYLGLFALDEGKFMDGINYLQKALILNPTNAQYAFDLANAYYLNGWIDEAVKFFNEAIIKEPDNKEFLYALAYLYYRNGDYEKTRGTVFKIFKIDENYLPAKILSALVKLETKDVLGARFELEQLVDLESEDDFAIFSLAKIYLELGLYEKAKTYMERALELKYDSLEYMCEYINIVIQEGNYEFAQKLVDKVKEVSENYFDNWVLQARIYDATENCVALFDTAQKLIEMDSNRYEGYYFNALALYVSEDVLFAIESLKKAISLNVNDASLYVLMSQFYQSIGRNEEALMYLDEATNIEPSAKNKELYMNLVSTVRRERHNSTMN